MKNEKYIPTNQLVDLVVEDVKFEDLSIGQSKYLSFLIAFTNTYWNFPSGRVACSYFGWASQTNAAQNTSTLIKKGYVRVMEIKTTFGTSKIFVLTNKIYD